jgi:hypothetical protein
MARAPGKGYIAYTDRGGRVYARFCKAFRDGGKKRANTVNLGLVIDREKGIFRNSKRGTFVFTVDGGYEELAWEGGPIPAGDVDFGDAWLLDSLASRSGWKAMALAALAEDAHSLLALAAFGALEPGYPLEFAETWWRGSYARFLYPGARLSAGCLADLLRRLSCREAAVYASHARFLSGAGGQAGSILYGLEGGLPPFLAEAAPDGVPARAFESAVPVEAAAWLGSAGLPAGRVALPSGYFSQGAVRSLREARLPFSIEIGRESGLPLALASKHKMKLLLNPRNFHRLGNGSGVFAKHVKERLLGQDIDVVVGLDLSARPALSAWPAASLEPCGLEGGGDAALAGPCFAIASSSPVAPSEIGKFLAAAGRRRKLAELWQRIFPPSGPLGGEEEARRGLSVARTLSGAARAMAEAELGRSGCMPSESLFLLRRLKAGVSGAAAVSVRQPSSGAVKIAESLGLAIPEAPIGIERAERS